MNCARIPTIATYFQKHNILHLVKSKSAMVETREKKAYQVGFDAKDRKHPDHYYQQLITQPV